MGETGVATLKVGLFGYDISCLVGMCASVDQNEGDSGTGMFTGYCGLIESRGLDGLAFGIYWTAEYGTSDYCAGFRNNEPGNRTGNTKVCFEDDEDGPYTQ